jgi:CRP-like cAMP-binding protein
MASPIDLLKDKLHVCGGWEQEILLNRNEYLKLPDTLDSRVFLLNSGSIRIFISDENVEHTIRFAYQGNIFTTIDSFFSNRPSPMAIQALRKTRVSVMSKTAFLHFIEQDEENKNLWQQILQGLIVQQLEREIDLLTASPAERYLRVLHRSPQLFQEVPHRFIASYLRMTPETLSRLKKS